MATTADKAGRANYCSTGAEDSIYGGRPHGLQTGHAHPKVKPSAVQQPKLAPEKSLPDDPMLRRNADLRSKQSLRFKEKIGVMRVVFHGITYEFIPVVDTPAESPEPTSPAPAEHPSAKAFIKHMEHMNYLKRVSMGDRPPITPETVFLATMAWHLIWKASDFRMPVPAAGTGPDGEMFYAWNCGRYHLELEIIPGQPAEFFYRDRETGEFWGADYSIGAPLPAEIVSKLNLFR